MAFRNIIIITTLLIGSCQTLQHDNACLRDCNKLYHQCMSNCNSSMQSEPVYRDNRNRPLMQRSSYYNCSERCEEFQKDCRDRCESEKVLQEKVHKIKP